MPGYRHLGELRFTRRRQAWTPITLRHERGPENDDDSIERDGVNPTRKALRLLDKFFGRGLIPFHYF